MEKHILFLTWKDIKHPRRGGAEIVIHEYAKRLVSDGNKVTWLGSGFMGGAENEVIDGVKIVRKYSINTIYFFAWKWYKDFIKSHPVDIIVDEAGGIPLLSPLYEKQIPIYFFIHHIGDHEYETAFLFPFNKVFKSFVFWTFSLYKNLPTITVSQSTASELQKNHLFKKVHIVENTTHMTPVEKIDWKNKKKEIVFYGRLTRMKRVDHAIRAFFIFSQSFPNYTLNIVGDAQDKQYYEELQNLVTQLGLKDIVIFRGYSQKKVEKYLSRSVSMIVPSTKEGYGLVVLEANCYGVPVIAYDVPGLRDSVREGKNGFLVPDGNSDKMGNTLKQLIGTTQDLTNISESSLNFVKDFGGWNERYKEFKEIILK